MVAAVAAPIAALTGLSTATATTLATGALYLATTAASIFLQMSMMEKPQQEIGTKLDAVLGGAVNQAIHIGRKETAGSFIYKGAWGKSGGVPNAFLVKVYCLSDRPVAGFEDYVWVDGIKCNYDPEETQTIDGFNVGHPINKWDSSGGHRLWVKFHDGTQTNADNYLEDKFGTGPRAWTADHIGRGRAYIIVTQKYDKKNPTGEAEVIAVVQNTNLYDFRNDSTNGGSGSQRYQTESTWGVNPGNPITAAYHVMRGVYRNNEWIYGGQKWPASRFDTATWTAAANKCDTDVPVAGGGTINYGRMGAEIDVSEEPWTVIERMLRSCNGRIVESGGKFKVYVGGIGASVHTFTDEDVILSEELTDNLFPSRDQIVNTVNGTYVEPDNAGEAKAYKPRTNSDYVDEDGDIRKTTLDFEYVRDNRQAQRMANLALKDNRRFRTFSVAFWSWARKLEPCDVVTWTSDRFQFVGKRFILGDVVLRDDGIVIVNMRESDPNDDNWTTADEDAYAADVFDDIDEGTQTLTATVTAVPFQDDTGKDRRPAIRIQATLDDDFVDCLALKYQVRKMYGDQKVIHRGRSEGFFDVGNADYGDITFTSQSIATLKAKWVQVRYKILPESDRETEWSDWVDHAVNLDDLGIDDDDTSDTLLAAPTSLSVTKVQDKDEDGTIRTFLKLNCTAPAWAGPKAEFIYEVVVTGDDTYRVKSKSEKARFRVNRTNRLHTVRAAARNGVGQISDWTASVGLTPSKKAADASAITGVSIARKTGANVITWDRISDPDNREVAIMRGTTNVLASMSEIGRTKATKWRDDENITKGVRYYYRVLPVDTSDNVGVSASAAVDDVETGIVLTDTDTVTLLAAPTGISLSQANRDVDKDGTVDIALKTQFSGGVAGAGSYEVQWLDSAGQTGYAQVAGGIVFFKAVTIRSYQVRWRTITWNEQPSRAVADGLTVGQPGAWSSYSGSVTPSPTTGAPATPPFVNTVSNDYGIHVNWSQPTELDYAYTEVWGGTASSQTDPFMTTSNGSCRVYTTDPGGGFYIWIRHVNTSGLKSGWTRASLVSIPKMFVGNRELIGASASGSCALSVWTGAMLTLTWVCDNNFSGVSVTLGSRTYTSIQFVLNQPMTLSHWENGSASSFSASKSAGQWRNAILSAAGI